MCSGTSVFIALETYRDNSMVLALSRKIPPLQFPMEKWESYVIIPEADADLSAWFCRDFCCPHNRWCHDLPEEGEFEAYAMHVRAGRRALRRIKQSAGLGSSMCWLSSGHAFRPFFIAMMTRTWSLAVFLTYNHMLVRVCVGMFVFSLACPILSTVINLLLQSKTACAVAQVV